MVSARSLNVLLMQLARHGVALPRSTLTRWMALIAFWLQPIYEIIRATVLAFADTREGIELVGCWAHARCHFHDAREHVPLRANWVLYQIQNLYRIEARLRKSKAGPALREAVRTAQSTMVLDRLKRALENMEASQRHLPSSTFGKAISYTLTHWELLTKYVANGRIEPERSAGTQPQAARRASEARQIDNKGVENAI
jgi:hypothetical protein